jgi:hypothetical protein
MCCLLRIGFSLCGCLFLSCGGRLGSEGGGVVGGCRWLAPEVGVPAVRGGSVTLCGIGSADGSLSHFATLTDFAARRRIAA